ncbi:synaptic plasticity regulator PANTS-like [Lytechinus pictus]|uniref:synaptic plasticity regulator PANTS-like n=1 Tax=Lytechinus pictus TaxID=7653 RepID=UPI0030B9CE12
MNMMENPEEACMKFLEKWLECKSLGGQFHSYYVYGERRDCTQLKENFDLCLKRDSCPKAKNSLEEREANLARENSCLWELRSHPPKDWPKPGSSIHPKPSAEQIRITSCR